MMTTGELAAAIAGLRTLPPVERARTAATLADAAREVLAAVRQEAAAEAVAASSAEAVAAELGINSSKVYRMVAAHKAARAGGA